MNFVAFILCIMSAFEVSHLLGFNIFTDTLDKLKLNSKILVNTINQYSFIVAEKDTVFKQALQGSDILLPDGIGIVAASNFLKGVKIQKIAGADVHKYLLEELNKLGGSCMYLGSSDKTLGKIRKRLAQEYPGIKANFFSPPYKVEFTEDDNAIMVAAVNSVKPDVLFVGMTAPKQEKWSFVNKDQLDTNIICSIGAVFDFYAGTVKRPNKIFICLGLEWFGRLVKEPKRMWKRYIYYGMVFGLILSKEKLRLYRFPFLLKLQSNR